MSKIRLALLDMNNNHPNQGMMNIVDISYEFQRAFKGEIEFKIFDVRFKNEFPNLNDFDIFISSGGPGNPHKEGHEWETKFSDFLDGIWKHNQTQEQKKFLFLICHSFQMAAIHWNLGNVCKRKSYSFGVMPIHKTKDGEVEWLFNNLPEPFYGVDSRAYQLIEPNDTRFKELGMKIVAIEKDRPHISLERAVMAIRFSEHIFGTQFHPEANPDGMLINLEDERNRSAMIENFGIDKFQETIDHLDDEDKILLTQAQILPRFLMHAYQNIRQMSFA